MQLISPVLRRLMSVRLLEKRLTQPQQPRIHRQRVGTQVTRIALDFGYDSPAAFSTMFRRVLGQAPSVWLEGAK